MKHVRNILYGLMVVVLIIFAVSCGQYSADNNDQNGQTVDTGDEIKSTLSRDTNPQLQAGELEALVNGNSEFALDLYRQARDRADNLFFSPHSLSIALAMVYAGARGETETQMADALHFNLSQDRLHKAFDALDLELAKRGEGAEGEEFKLHICNAAWGQRGFSFLQSYLDVLALNYGAGLRLLDFLTDPEGSRLEINDWVSQQTGQRIQDLLSQEAISEATRLVLTNTIYFKAQWLYVFDKNRTAEAPFYTLEGEEVPVPMMQRTETFGYTGVDGFYQAVELPYKGEEVSMVVILPAVGQFAAFEAALEAATLRQIVANLSYTRLSLSMPKFEFKWGESLVPILKALGMIKAFGMWEADFSGIDGDYDLFISEVMHKSFVAVDEEGTEAAAATGVVVDLTAAPTISMRINRPFIFLIRDRATNAILFLGRVVNPE